MGHFSLLPTSGTRSKPVSRTGFNYEKKLPDATSVTELNSKILRMLTNSEVRPCV